MIQKLLSFVLLLVFVQISPSQSGEKPKDTGIPDELKKEAAAFVRETANDVNSLQTLENRISFSSELAGLMWFSNEEEAREMFRTVINDFRQLLAGYDAQIAANNAPNTNDDDYSFLLGGGNKPERKFSQALAVRQQIARVIAEHDPQLALTFFGDTRALITNEKFRKRLESSDASFEARLLSQIAENDVDTALKYGRKSVAKGFNYETINLLKKIYAKDQDKGIAFGEEVVSKLKSAESKPDTLYNFARVLNLGLENLDATKGKSGKKPMFSEQNLRDIAEIMAQQILKRDDLENYQVTSYVNDIEKLLPARATQIQQKFDLKERVKTTSGIAVKIGNASAPPPPPPPVPKPSSPSKNSPDSRNILAENLTTLGTKTLSEDERKKVIEQSRKIIAETPNREQRLFALSALAIQTAKLGDKALASEIMAEVQSAVNLQPKNYREFLEVWLLAGNYSQVDAQKAFPILENAIFRINDTINAAVKVGEFIDANEDFIINGEVQVGGFGNEITGELLRNIGATDSTIRNLAIADFARTKSLTGKFDRTEVRILAKMLVLRSIFSAIPKSKSEDIMTDN